MLSMTGYGKGEAEKNGLKVTVEFKSVNHRFLDLNFKLPRGMQYLEDVLRKTIAGGVKRGHVDVFVNLTKTGAESVALNRAAAENYLKMAEELEKMGVENDLTASVLLRLPDVVSAADGEDEEILSEVLKSAAVKALDALVAMRKTEGAALVKDLTEKAANLSVLLKEVEERAPKVREVYFVNLRKRVAELVSDASVDDARIAAETAVFADKCAIDEEIVRLSGHIAHFYEIIANGSGKQLDFLVQEMGREVNTIGSKSNDLYITERVLSMKNEVEKIREQVQNLE